MNVCHSTTHTHKLKKASGYEEKKIKLTFDELNN